MNFIEKWKCIIIIIANLHDETCLDFFIRRVDISWEYKRPIFNTLKKHITLFYPVYLSWSNVWNNFFHNFLSSLIKIVFSIIKKKSYQCIILSKHTYYTMCLKVMCNFNTNWFEKQIESDDFTKVMYETN